MEQEILIKFGVGVIKLTVMISNLMVRYNVILSDDEEVELSNIIISEMMNNDDAKIKQLIEFYLNEKKK